MRSKVTTGASSTAMCTRALRFGVGCGGRVSGNVTLGRVVVDANVTVDVGGAFDSLELVSGAAFALRGGGVVKLQSLVVNQNATLVVGANAIFNVVASGSGVTNDGTVRLNDTLVVRGSFNQVCRCAPLALRLGAPRAHYCHAADAQRRPRRQTGLGRRAARRRHAARARRRRFVSASRAPLCGSRPDCGAVRTTSIGGLLRAQYALVTWRSPLRGGGATRVAIEPRDADSGRFVAPIVDPDRLSVIVGNSGDAFVAPVQLDAGESAATLTVFWNGVPANAHDALAVSVDGVALRNIGLSVVGESVALIEPPRTVGVHVLTLNVAESGRNVSVKYEVLSAAIVGAVSVTPKLIATRGGTPVRLEAQFWSANATWQCRFGASPSTPALRSQSGTTMLCVAPPGSGATGIVVSSSIANYTSTGDALMYADALDDVAASVPPSSPLPPPPSETTLASTTTTTSTSTVAPMSSAVTLSMSAIIGVAVGACLAVAAMIVLVVVCLARRRSSEKGTAPIGEQISAFAISC